MVHKLPFKEGFKSYIQPKRRMSAEETLKVQEEIERLFSVLSDSPICRAAR